MSLTKLGDESNRWVLQFQQGDEKAAQWLYQLHAKYVYHSILRIVGDDDWAKDLLQETFIKAFQQIQSFRGDASFKTWINRIGINMTLDFLRKKKIKTDDINDHQQLIDEEESWEQYPPENIHFAIKQLPHGCRTVLSLYVFEDYSHQEIGEKLGITESTSKTQYKRAKTLLKQLLEQSYGTERLL